MRTRPIAILLAASIAACGPSATTRATTPDTARQAASTSAPDEAPPDGPLPAGVTPLHYRIALEVLPENDRFRGEVWIRARLAEATSRIWIHGARMDVSAASIERVEEESDERVSVPATWHPAEREGIAALRTQTPVGPGDVTIHIAYEAPFDRQLKGLYRVDVGDDHYAFTQFEATSARYAFPSFDEPRWKTPFDIELTVHREHVAIANTRELERTQLESGLDRVRYATTLPLPTYLVAMAVGPLDVVEGAAIPPSAVRSRPLPFRGIAARGRGPELAHAMEHTPRIVAALEDYFGTEYPYDKLDIIAVPDFASGAMENAGAITFREFLLLLGASPPEDQVRGFANVMAHELAHQWFGNLVTMPWWDDIWLNEAFATWMASKTVARVYPEMNADLAQLAAVHGAMGQDSLASARRIRQPIESDHDIRNAFDSITYSKGAGVLSMFEAWVGEDVFREGIRTYLRQHRFGTATSEDLLAALSESAGRDVMTPFRTFLEQPGVPLVEARLECATGAQPVVHLAQSRYTPVGSTAPRDRTWSIPVCITYPARGTQLATTCELMSAASADLSLADAQGCPAWVMPNAGARGYYRWTLPPEQLRPLMERGGTRLSPMERASVANNLRAAFASATIPGGDVIAAMPRIASDSVRIVATDPMGLASNVVDQIVSDEHEAAARTWASGLYRASATRLGWTPRPREDGDTRLLRRDVLGFMASVARDPRVRSEAARRGRAYLGAGGDGAIHADAVAPDLAGIAAAVAVQEGDAALFDAVQTTLFATEDAVVRARLIAALSSTEDAALAARALDLGLDARLRVNEVLIPLSVQAEHDEGRERAWAWLVEHFDALSARIATTRAGATPWLFAGFCSRDDAERVRTFFEPRIAGLAGGPRNLAGALEAIELCAARVQAQRASVEQAIAR
ncbi:M1 family metallopeptidase [Sandaracinus amylolyticus]|uniref:Aminopeptidase n=1 Tax=Sandaracinus amylolyticus TaxID=927083 RepID=A0A0F6W7R5_9BACT|nr:M1 family metallopeptidase [Sandaracinus amylolyticus]AKF09650.1 Membrane alanine aminopeptidase N [Sandaracinus amylolyticus]